MTPNNDTPATHSTPTRAHQQDARAWANFTGCKYTEALRQMQSPLAQGLLGERVSARTLIETLEDHEVVGSHGGDPVLGDSGYYVEESFTFDGKTDFIKLALVTEVLRMFTPIPETSTPEVITFGLKHTAEVFLGHYDQAYSYVSTGELIWAAAAMGLQLSTTDAEGVGSGFGPHLWVGIAEREYDYVDRMVRSEIEPDGHHYRPARYTRLQDVLSRAVAGEIVTDDWTPPAPDETPTPFHDWLTRQTDRDDPVGDVARDYATSVHWSEHGIAGTPGDLLAMFNEVDYAPKAYDALVRAITEYMRTDPAAAPFRTVQDTVDTWEADGFGTGAWAVERVSYLCPCGDGDIIEMRKTIMSEDEDEVFIVCHRCINDWEFAPNRSVRDWGLVPNA